MGAIQLPVSPELKEEVNNIIPDDVKIGDKFKLSGGREVIITEILPDGTINWNIESYIDIGPFGRKEETKKELKKEIKKEEIKKLEEKKKQDEKKAKEVKDKFPYLDIDYIYEMIEDENLKEEIK